MNQLTRIIIKTILWMIVIGLIFIWFRPVEAKVDKEQLFILSQEYFLQDMANWLHKYEATSKNKCSYNIASIAYWFAKMESSVWSFGMSIYTHNWTSLHPWGRYYYKWDWKSKSCKGECLRNYKTVEKGLVDFMYLYKYGYWCQIKEGHIRYFIYWGMWWKYTQKQINHSKAYFDNLVKNIEYFENKHFKKNK